MQYTENLLLELNFKDTTPLRVQRLGRVLGNTFKEILNSKSLSTDHLETFFSTRRIVLVTGRLSCKDRCSIPHQLRLCLKEVLQDLKTTEQDTWSNLVSILAFWGHEHLKVPDFDPEKQGSFTLVGPTMNRVEVTGVKDYWQKAQESHLLIDNWVRENHIRKLISAKQREVGGEVLTVPWFGELVTAVEQPTVIVIPFASEFLSLPKPILMRVMEANQLLPVTTSAGTPLNQAIAICDGVFSEQTSIQKGYQKALNSALGEALHLYLKDLEISLEQRVDMLKGLDYLDELGSYFDKQSRLQKLCIRILDRLDAGQALYPIALQSAKLCKVDLTTDICRCFPGLEGQMGELMVANFDEPSTVGIAIREHLSDESGEKLPQTLVGAVLGIADRLDDICGFYHRGEMKLSQYKSVKGRFDDLIAIIDSIALDASVERLVKFALSLYESQRLVPWRDKDLKRLMEVFDERLGQFLRGKGYRSQTIDAILGAVPDNVYAVIKKAEVLDSTDEEEQVDLCYKALISIDRACPRDFKWEEAAREFLDSSQEKELFELFLTIREDVLAQMDSHNYRAALYSLSRLQLPLGRFMTEVGIATDDQPLFFNRLCLMAEIRALILKFADFTYLGREDD